MLSRVKIDRRAAAAAAAGQNYPARRRRKNDVGEGQLLLRRESDVDVSA